MQPKEGGEWKFSGKSTGRLCLTTRNKFVALISLTGSTTRIGENDCL